MNHSREGWTFTIVLARVKLIGDYWEETIEPKYRLLVAWRSRVLSYRSGRYKIFDAQSAFHVCQAEKASARVMS